MAGNADLSAVEASAPIAAADLPILGMFYSAQNPNFPPAPGNFDNLSAWDLGQGNFLLDDVDSGFHAQGAMDGVPAPPGDGDDGGGWTNSYVPYTFDPSGLWLEMLDVTNGLADLLLHNPTNLEIGRAHV